MQNLLIENVPDELVKEFGKKVSYSFFVSKIKERKINYWTDDEINNLGKTSSIFSNSF